MGSQKSSTERPVSEWHCFYLCGLCHSWLITQCHGIYLLCLAIWRVCLPLATSYLNDRLSFFFRVFSLAFVLQSSIFSDSPFLWLLILPHDMSRPWNTETSITAASLKHCSCTLACYTEMNWSDPQFDASGWNNCQYFAVMKVIQEGLSLCLNRSAPGMKLLSGNVPCLCRKGFEIRRVYFLL